MEESFIDFISKLGCDPTLSISQCIGDHSTSSVVVVCLLISVYAIWCVLRLLSLTRAPKRDLEVLGETVASKSLIEFSAQERKQNAFVEAWLNMVHQHGIASVRDFEDKYIERHPSFYLNEGILRTYNFDLDDFEQKKQTIYFLAIFFTFAGILLTLYTMIPILQAPNPEEIKQKLSPFLGSFALKFAASLTGIFWMLIYSSILQSKVGWFNRNIQRLQGEIISKFRGTSEIDLDLGTNLDRFRSVMNDMRTACAELKRAMDQAGTAGIGQHLENIEGNLQRLVELGIGPSGGGRP